MDKPAPKTRVRLRTFVAWSLIAHVGAGMAWGVPALVAKRDAMELDRSVREMTEHLAKEAVKAKAHAQEQRIESTRKQVDAQLREQFERLTQAMTAEEREKLWQELSRELADSQRSFASALANPDVSEQDLRNLELQLQREMIEELDEMLAVSAEQALVERFLAQVSGQVAPELARRMQEQVRERVAKQAREQGDRLVREQREAADRQRDASANAARDARDRVNEAADLAKQERADAKRSRERLQESGKRLERAAQQLAAAAQRSPDLGAAARAGLAEASEAVKRARDAVAAAREAKPEQREARAAEADVALDLARQAAAQAVEAVEKADGREALAKSALGEAAHRELTAAAEQSFGEQFRAETVPRLQPKLAQAFAEQMRQNGMDDPKLAASVAATAAQILAAQVPELAKAGQQVAERFADLPPPPAAAAPAPAPNQAEPARIDLGPGPAATAEAAKPQASELDRKLEAGLEKLAADARSRAAQVAKDGRHDGDMMRLARGDGAGDAAALDMRERIGRMAEGMRNGRVGGLAGFGDGLSGLRQGALGGVLFGGAPRRIDRELYERLAGEIADRGLVRGEAWAQSGASGEASRADAAARGGPARIAGADNAQVEATATNTHPFQPAFKTLAFASIPCLPGDFAIDGRAEKWRDIVALPLKPEHGADPAVQLMQLGWRSDGLYCRFAVRDPDRTLSKTNVNSFWVADTVEVWIDSLNSKEKFRARHAGQQFWIWPDGSADDPAATGGESVVERRGGHYVPRVLHQAELQRATTLTPEGYIVEFRLPAERLPDADFAPGRIIGFNAYVSTRSTTDWYWSAGKAAATYAQPDTWGDLLLAGSDARVELVQRSTEGRSAAPELLLPGRPLALRVVDGDMDLSPTRRDKVMLTLRRAHGGQHTMVLEETGVSTGVFEGSTSTALALGDEQPGVLAVYEGERVEACYLDQARANGARNAEVRLPLRFASVLSSRAAAQ